MSLISQKAFNKIKPNMSISLGGGSNVLNLAKDISQAHISNLKLYSPSEITQAECRQFGLEVLSFSENSPHLDLAFDGCDNIDKNFNALKSGGGIHLFEKIAAEKSTEYILLAPKERFTENLNSNISLCIEVVPTCLNSLLSKIPNDYTHRLRLGHAVASFARSPLGNFLIDIYPKYSWNSIDKLNDFLLKQNGVVSSSYFKNLVTSLITEDKGQAVEIKKG